jgi:hypothetical protein
MGPLMFPTLVCDWCGTCAVIPAARAPEAVGLDGVPRDELALPILLAAGWRETTPGEVRCPADFRDHQDAPAPPPPTLSRRG